VSENSEGPRGDLNPAAEGHGPLFQRDYWAVVRSCEMRPPELVEWVRRWFTSLPPREMATFRSAGEPQKLLEVGDELDIWLPGAGKVGVRVVHRDANSVTMATLKGHPIAGRITFGAYPNDRDDVIFHIRSRSRSSTLFHHLGFVIAGEPMQTTTWTDFIDRLAHTVGSGVIGVIHEETSEVAEPEEQADSPMSPTFVARGK